MVLTLPPRVIERRMSPLARQSVAGLRLLLAFTLLLGLAYPIAVWAVGRTVPVRADGSLVQLDEKVVGSRLIGQTFEGDEWFQSRPSAAGDGYDPLSSGASNLGPENQELLASVADRLEVVAAREGVSPQDVPPDAVTASGSGLDPHISPEYARLQLDRVARERGLDPAQVQRLVEDATADRSLGFLGEPVVNVVDLNLALARLGEA